MKKNHIFYFLGFLFMLISCQTDDEAPMTKTQERIVSFVDKSTIPDVMDQLGRTVESRIEKRTSANIASSSIGSINLDRIMKVIDTLKNTNYTFLVDDGDNDPFTFTNMLVKKREDESLDYPYLLEYTVDSAFREEFVSNGFAMDHFTGTILKRYLQGFSKGEFSANLEKIGEVTPNDSECNRQTDYNGGTGGTNGGVVDSGNADNGNSSDGGSTLFCYQYMEPVQMPNDCDPEESSTTGGASPNFGEGCNPHDFNGHIFDWENSSHTVQYILVTKCVWVNSSSSYDDSMCPNPETEDIGINSGILVSTQFIASIIDLNSSQVTWLENHPEEAFEIAEVLSDDSYKAEDNTITNESKKATELLISLASSNSLSGIGSTEYINVLKGELGGFPSFLPSMAPQIAAAHFSHYLALKQEHPGWSDMKLHWHAFNEILHTGLDIIGLVPGFGEVADLINGGIYAIEGDFSNASLSLAAAIPIAGWTATTAKWAKRAYKLANGKKVLLTMYNTTGGIIKFSYRGQLRKVLEIGSLSTKRAHHVIPWGFNEHPVVQAAAKSFKGWHPNDLLNGIPVDKIRHAGSHTNYDNYVNSRLQAFQNSQGGSINQEAAYNFLKSLADELKQKILDNPSKTINELF